MKKDQLQPCAIFSRLVPDLQTSFSIGDTLVPLDDLDFKPETLLHDFSFEDLTQSTSQKLQKQPPQLATPTPTTTSQPGHVAAVPVFEIFDSQDLGDGFTFEDPVGIVANHHHNHGVASPRAITAPSKLGLVKLESVELEDGFSFLSEAKMEEFELGDGEDQQQHHQQLQLHPEDRDESDMELSEGLHSHDEGEDELDDDDEAEDDDEEQDDDGERDSSDLSDYEEGAELDSGRRNRRRATGASTMTAGNGATTRTAGARASGRGASGKKTVTRRKAGQAGVEQRERKKPGRKPKILDEETRRMKRQARQEKNRLAARKCREKKQSYFHNLEDEVLELRKAKADMAVEISLLNQEIQYLRSKMTSKR